MEQDLLSQKELVELTGLTYPEISRIISGKRKVSVRQAKLLSRTGWPEVTWLYPKEYPGNPYLNSMED